MINSQSWLTLSLALSIQVEPRPKDLKGISQMLLGHASVIPAVVEDLRMIVFTKYTGFLRTHGTLGSQLMPLMPKPGIPGSRQYLLNGHGYLGAWMENSSDFTHHLPKVI